MTVNEGPKHSYPVDHWRELRRFFESNELDPKRAFRLSDDTWEAWTYSDNYSSAEAEKYRFRFGHLNSFLKLYVKRYCYSELLGRNGLLKTGNAALPYNLSRADRYISEHDYHSLDDLAQPNVFDGVWASQLKLPDLGGIERGGFDDTVVTLQSRTRSFWIDLSLHFGSPLLVPQVAPHTHRTPLEIGLDKSRLIPDAVLSRLINKLALHRDGISKLTRFTHLRLCVLLLLFCLGRRVCELLSTPRGEGENGPLERYPCRHDEGDSTDALWFTMRPNKGGPSEYVYISPEWENLAIYCVRQLINYSDEVRHLASSHEKHLFILISAWNYTARYQANRASTLQPEYNYTDVETAADVTSLPNQHPEKVTTALSYQRFREWLNGKANLKHPKKKRGGVLERWNITEDGSADGPIYRLKTHYGRHTRQSAIAVEPQISLMTRQHDLNHRHADMQFAYQHMVEEQNIDLMSKVSQAPLIGQSDGWLSEVLCMSRTDEESSSPSKYQPGLVQLLTPRWRKLLEGNPLYIESNRAPLGVCEELNGPEDCLTYQRKNKVKARTSSKDVSSIDSSVAVQDAGNEAKGRSQQHKKKASPSVVKSASQPAANTSPATKTEDVLKRLRERRKLIEGDRDGEVK